VRDTLIRSESECDNCKTTMDNRHNSTGNRLDDNQYCTIEMSDETFARRTRVSLLTSDLLRH